MRKRVLQFYDITMTDGGFNRMSILMTSRKTRPFLKKKKQKDFSLQRWFSGWVGRRRGHLR
jgi:hypothetical protein